LAPPIPFVEQLGFTLHKMENGESELPSPARPLNTFGVTHGGASMTLLDVTMAVAARSVESDDFGWSPSR
jgi:acyl-coenzyme A thioesterase PaaI-like protein